MKVEPVAYGDIISIHVPREGDDSGALSSPA